MLFNDHIVVSTDPEAIATFASVQSGTWHPPAGEIFDFLQIHIVYAMILVQLVHPGHHGQEGGEQLKSHQVQQYYTTKQRF